MRDVLLSLLGDLPVKIPPKVISRTTTDLTWALREDLLLDLNGLQPVPAAVFTPQGPGAFRWIIYSHAHGGAYEVGKRELIESIPYMQPTPYSRELVSLGYAVICIDAWGFGQRCGRSESELFKEFLWKGSCLWGMMVFDTLQVLEYLHLREDVDTTCIGIMGMSMGSTMAWWCAALDERISYCIDICCLTDFGQLLENRALDLHGLYYYVPGLIKKFSTASILSLIAPRRHFSLVGTHDPLTPMKGVAAIHQQMCEVYKDTPGAWKLSMYDCGHEETPEMRSDILEYLSSIT